MKDLTFLGAKRNKIADVTPLQDLVKLQSLFLSDNNITDISSLRLLRNLSADGSSFSRNPIINKTCPFDNKKICKF